MSQKPTAPIVKNTFQKIRNALSKKARMNDSIHAGPLKKSLAARYSPAGDSRSTLAAGVLNFRVRNGDGCDYTAMATRQK